MKQNGAASWREARENRARKRLQQWLGPAVGIALVLAVTMLASMLSSGAKAAASSQTSASTTGTQGAHGSIAVIPKSVGLFYWNTVHAGAAAAGKKFGYNIVWKGTATESDITGEVNIVQDFVNGHINGIAVAASDEHALVPAIRQGLARGIPIVGIDSGVQPNITNSLIATNNIKASAQGADILARLLHGKGKVAILAFNAGSQTDVQREAGFKDELKKYPGMKLVATQYDQSDVPTALSLMENILTSNPDLAGVFAASEAGAVGAIQALAERHLFGKVKVVGFDNAPDEVTALKQHEIQALVVQNPYKIGYEGVATIVNILNHKPHSKAIDTGSIIATAQNMNQPNIHRILVPPQLP